MSDPAQTRREFLRTTSAAVAGAAMAGHAFAADPPDRTRANEAKPLNYNPKMGYRRLGKTGILISEISLGGHGGKSAEERRPILERAIEAGMNYVDNNIAEECDMYGKAMKGLRDKFHIGFASWPEKLTSEYEKEVSKDYFLRNIDARLKSYHTDMLDMWRPVGATWGEGQTNQKTMLEITPRTLDMVVAAFETARKQGKVRFLGVSGHNPKVFRRVLNNYPQFSVILFPYMFLTKPFGGDSLLALAKEKDVGVIAIKPFAAGATFVGGTPVKFDGKVDERARSLLKVVLQEKRLSAVVPGVTDPDQIASNVRASYERNQALTHADHDAMRSCTASFHAHLPRHYHWLHGWETV